jgi:tetratricopeptide (TPR) repeat protein
MDTPSHRRPPHLGRWLRRGTLGLLLGVLGPTVAWANPSRILSCLNEVDVPCAEAVLDGYDLEAESDPELLYLAARTRFFAGRFDEAYPLIARAVENGYDDRWDELSLYERTRRVSQDLVEEVRDDRYVVRYRPGLDAVLIEEAFDAMRRSERNLAPLLGGPPPGKVTVEIYPSAQTFTAVSSLTEKDVKTTGVVALSKWSRLLITSPRALGRGYDWQDTIAHEYIHQVVSHHSGERSPVWLQEALAKYLDNRWRDGRNAFRLEPRAEALLARAIAEDRLVPFEAMHPSLAKLPSADLAALAYAQLASLMDFIVQQNGEAVIRKVLPRVRAMEDPRVALSEEAGFSSFQALEDAWKAWVVDQGLRDRNIAELPPGVDAGDPVEGDPVMSERRDLARFMRLGELLAQRGHHEAALLEFAKADDQSTQASPLLRTRQAQSHAALGDVAQAREQLRETVSLYPDYTRAWKALGTLEMGAGRLDAAREAYARVVAFDPYDAEVHELLVSLFGPVDPERARRHAEQLSILRRGGKS